MSYTGDNVRRVAEAYRAEMRRCDEARHEMVKEFLARIRAQDKKRSRHEHKGVNGAMLAEPYRNSGGIAAN